MTLEEFKNLAAGFQSLTIAAAVVIGGAWALYRFLSLKTIEKARADLERTKRQLQARGLLQLELSARELFMPENDVMLIELRIAVTNVGTGPEILNWNESSVTAARLTHDSELKVGTEVQGRYLTTDSSPLYGCSIHPTQIEGFSFVISVTEPGLYLIEARISGSPEEAQHTKNEAESGGVDVGDSAIVWQDTIYFNVSGVAPRQPVA